MKIWLIFNLILKLIFLCELIHVLHLLNSNKNNFGYCNIQLNTITQKIIQLWGCTSIYIEWVNLIVIDSNCFYGWLIDWIPRFLIVIWLTSAVPIKGIEERFPRMREWNQLLLLLTKYLACKYNLWSNHLYYFSMYLSFWVIIIKNLE